MKNKEIPKLKFHDKSCDNCRYYRIHQLNSDCLLLGRTLSIRASNSYCDKARFCIGWKRRPKTWDIYNRKSPFWGDIYISRETQIRLRQQKGIK